MTTTGIPQKFRQVLSLVCVLLMLGTGVLLQAQQPAPPAPAPPPAQLMSPEQLNNLVAPIALYPDNLIGQVLVASTYPLEIVEAAQWLQQNRNLQGSQLVDAARQQNWDPSIQALVVFPDVLNRLNSDIRWTTDLGNAFLAQQADVMHAVQRLRAQAQASGKLNSTPQETVTTQSQGGQTSIDIAPANPQVVYVPVYDPAYIWGPPAWGYYPPLYYPAFGFGFGFGPGIYIGSFFGGLGWGGWGWGPNWFGGGIFLNAGFFGRYGYGGYGPGFRGGYWQHDASHRPGVSYPNASLSNRYASASRASLANRGSVSARTASPSGGWNRFGQPGSSGAVAAQRNGFSAQSSGRTAGESGWSRFGSTNAQSGVRSSPATGATSGYRSTPSTGGGYSAGRAAPSYRASPSSGAGYRSAPSSGGGGGSRGGGGGGSHGGGGGSHGGGGHGGGHR
jgi:hypothetical protein